MKLKIFIGVVSLLTLSVIFLYVLNIGSNIEDSQINVSKVLSLPDSPLDASYGMDGDEILFIDNFYEDLGNGVTASVIGEPVFGDISGNGKEDAVILFEYNKDNTVSYYIAVALKYNDGFLGMGAVLLEDTSRPQGISIRDELIIVEIKGFGGNDNIYKYYNFIAGNVHSVDLLTSESDVFSGVVMFDFESYTFNVCNTDEMLKFAEGSNSLGALKAIYKERTREGSGLEVYVVIAGQVLDTGEIKVESILSAPKNGVCEKINTIATSTLESL